MRVGGQRYVYLVRRLTRKQHVIGVGRTAFDYLRIAAAFGDRDARRVVVGHSHRQVVRAAVIRVGTHRVVCDRHIDCTFGLGIVNGNDAYVLGNVPIGRGENDKRVGRVCIVDCHNLIVRGKVESHIGGRLAGQDNRIGVCRTTFGNFGRAVGFGD